MDIHTREPWKVSTLVPLNICDEKGTLLADTCSGWQSEEGIREENARRIVACVNACAGISTDDLESVGLGSVDELADLAKEKIERLEAELRTLNDREADAVGVVVEASDGYPWKKLNYIYDSSLARLPLGAKVYSAPIYNDMDEDARRAAACIKSCENIPTEALESGEARQVRDELADIYEVETKNDILVKALEEIIALQNTESDEWDAVERLIPEMIHIAKVALIRNKGKPNGSLP